jgi:hypothetical protein
VCWCMDSDGFCFLFLDGSEMMGDGGWFSQGFVGMKIDGGKGGIWDDGQG